MDHQCPDWQVIGGSLNTESKGSTRQPTTRLQTLLPFFLSICFSNIMAEEENVLLSIYKATVDSMRKENTTTGSPNVRTISRDRALKTDRILKIAHPFRSFRKGILKLMQQYKKKS
jgi:hypothetical protein